MADDTEWLTYDVLASRLGISGESARNLVRRRRWQRRQGNDGIAVVAVPVDYIATRVAETMGAEAPVIPPVEPPEAEEDGGDDIPPDPAIALALTALTAHVERQAAEIERLQVGSTVLAAERDAAREAVADLRVQVAEIQARAAAGEARATDLIAERDRWATLATAPRGLRAWVEMFAGRRRA